MSKIILNGIEYSNGITYQELQPIIYSDEEREIGVWRDNKPLYQKTLPFTTDSGSNITSYAHGIADIDTVVGYSGVIIRADGASIDINDSRWQGTAEDLVGCIVSKTSISVFINYSSYRNLPIYVTIQYTKTTDVAGSGNWNTDGVPTHHYSTNEQVIGTWIDGKPLYEIVIKTNSITINAGATYNLSLSNYIQNYDELAFFWGKANTLNRSLPLNVGASNIFGYVINADADLANGVIRINRGSTGSITDSFTFILRYTKTTD